MNTHFNSALKQSTSIRSSLSALDPQTAPPATLTPATIGSLSASLTSFARTIDEYHALAKQELNPAKQEKALERIRNFRSELQSFRAQLDTLKTARDEQAHAQNRAELLGRRPFVSSTPENPYAASTSTSTSASASGYGVSGHARTNSSAEAGRGGALSLGGGGGAADATRESHALREQDFFRNTHSSLDEYIARGQQVLGDLNQQRDMLKNTQRKLYSVAGTLGISGSTIRMIDRRARQDKWIFWAGVVVFFLFCWLVVHYLR
ncbi:hypothetical protein B0T22DRAFT_460214 [Podospora appendiculata]|uniref:Protein transport protein BOS1 n=1 Tax=Podospora appendiculata TaxID=314037 RepID=A0AAE0X9W5_9PEZI|nr:hypothetical protein B0T22DRAFT_460214 [Podospora appendiculata]